MSMHDAIQKIQNNPQILMALMALDEELQDRKKFTTPASIDDNVLMFAKTLVGENPRLEFIDLKPPDWSRARCCDLNVKEQIKLAGSGSMVFGYKIWYIKNKYIEGERHSVYASVNGKLHDVTYCEDGEHRVLFCVDNQMSTVRQSLLSQKPKMGFGFPYQIAVEIEQSCSESINIETLPDEMAWREMPTYAQWKRARG